MAAEDEQEERHSAVIRFVPTTCAVVFINHAREKPSTFVSMDLKVASVSELQDQDGRSLNDIRWKAQLYGSPDDMNENVRDRGAMGVLTHCKARETFDCPPEHAYFWAVVEPALFHFLKDVALSGKAPSSTQVTAVGLQHGSLPDGSPITWDIKKFESVDITDIDVVVGARRDDDPNDHVVNDHQPVDGSDLRDTTRNVTAAIAQHLHKSNTLLGWLLAASIVILVIILFRR